MQCRCPYKSCAQVFDVPVAIRVVGCPACENTIRPLQVEVWLQIDRQVQRLKEREKLADDETLSRYLAGPAARAGFIAVIEDVRSLWNVGSIFRTADGAGLGLLMLAGITGCPPRKEIAKTSLGSEDSVPWLYCGSVTDVLPQLKLAGFSIVGLEVTRGLDDVPDSVPLSRAIENGSLKAPLCLVVGNEVTGLSREALSACDLICDLPMRGIKESLNVAVAFGIAAYGIAEHLKVPQAIAKGSV